MRFARHTFVLLTALFVPVLALGADDLKVVLLDSKDGHGMRGKLVCIAFPTDDSQAGIVQHSRDCRRTDSGGAVEFTLPEGALAKVQLRLASDGLVPCFDYSSINLMEALRTGTVAANTCGEAKTETTEPGELVLFAHQTSLWEAMKARRNEF